MLCKESALTSEELLAMLTAVAHPLRLRIIAELTAGRVHVSELARRLGMSRPLLYMHLDKLEKAGIVHGHLELSEDGKAMKFYDLAPFELRINADAIVQALQADETETADETQATEAQAAEANATEMKATKTKEDG